MIDSVRKTVLSILNKNNYGDISPADFNLYAKQAQLDIFEDYFYDYNHQVNQENLRQSGTGYADIKKQLEEVIDSFSVETVLTQVTVSNNLYSLPADYYIINKLYYYSVLLATGTNTAVVPSRLIDVNANFNETVRAGDIVINLVTNANAYVLAVDTNTNLILSANIFPLIAEAYSIYSNTDIREVERVHQNRIFYLTSSSITAPSTIFPAYVLSGNVVTVYPSSINGPTDINSQYIRYPLDPKWTYFPIGLADSEPIFDQNALDYQDFELPDADEPNLVNKILQYAGISIRELEVYAIAQKEEDEQNIQEQN